MDTKVTMDTMEMYRKCRLFTMVFIVTIVSMVFYLFPGG